MKKIKVGAGGYGKVKIKVKKEREVNNLKASRMEMPSTSARGFGSVSIPLSIINQMELRVESAFRPDEQDVEVVYALSGEGKIIDLLHNLSSSKVVAHATPEMISYITENMVDYIKWERTKIPRIIIQVHTHPSWHPILSDVDKITMQEVAKRIQRSIPKASVFFGVHAVSSEYRQLRTPPEKVSENKLRWSSITRLHEVAFFDENATPIYVSISD